MGSIYRSKWNLEISLFGERKTGIVRENLQELTKTKLLAKTESMTGHLGERIYTCMFTCQK